MLSLGCRLISLLQQFVHERHQGLDTLFDLCVGSTLKAIQVGRHALRLCTENENQWHRVL